MPNLSLTLFRSLIDRQVGSIRYIYQIWIHQIVKRTKFRIFLPLCMHHLHKAAATPDSVLLVTSRCAHESRKSYLFTDPEYTFSLRSIGSLPQLLELLDDAPRRGSYAAGSLSYACRYAIAT